MINGEVSQYARCKDNSCHGRAKGLFSHKDKNVLFKKHAFEQHIQNRHNGQKQVITGQTRITSFAREIHLPADYEDNIIMNCLELVAENQLPMTTFESSGWKTFIMGLLLPLGVKAEDLPKFCTSARWLKNYAQKTSDDMKNVIIKAAKNLSSKDSFSLAIDHKHISQKTLPGEEKRDGLGIMLIHSTDRNG